MTFCYNVVPARDAPCYGHIAPTVLRSLFGLGRLFVNALVLA